MTVVEAFCARCLPSPSVTRIPGVHPTECMPGFHVTGIYRETFLQQSLVLHWSPAQRILCKRLSGKFPQVAKTRPHSVNSHSHSCGTLQLPVLTTVGAQTHDPPLVFGPCPPFPMGWMQLSQHIAPPIRSLHSNIWRVSHVTMRNKFHSFETWIHSLDPLWTMPSHRDGLTTTRIPRGIHGIPYQLVNSGCRLPTMYANTACRVCISST